jgi:low temperature requirement protein LtrA
VLFSAVLLVVDLATHVILLAIDLPFFLPSQFSPVGLAVSVNLLIDALFVVLIARGLAGRHRAIARAVGNAILLVLFALAKIAPCLAQLPLA